MPDTIYTPVVKAKLGELDAIHELAPNIRSMLRPLVEVTAPPFDYVEGRFDRTADDHLDAVSERMCKALAGVGEIMVDIPEQFAGGGETISATNVALVRFFESLKLAGLRAAPVLTPTTSTERFEVLSALSEGPPVLRATLDSLIPDNSSALTHLNRLVSALHRAGEPATLVLDLRSVAEGVHISATQWRHLISGTMDDFTGSRQFQHIAVVGSSFPRDLRDVTPGIDITLSRPEWRIWERLAEKMTRTDRYHYGDYPISHPELNEIDPRQMRMSANIRYTAEDHWVLVKGRNVRDYGYGQFRELAKALIDREEFCGRDYSWGDKFIWDCAQGDGGTGNATTWRKVGTNHHITLVANQLARQADSAEST